MALSELARVMVLDDLDAYERGDESVFGALLAVGALEDRGGSVRPEEGPSMLLEIRRAVERDAATALRDVGGQEC
jgi:hypothetical protein